MRRSALLTVLAFVGVSLHGMANASIALNLDFGSADGGGAPTSAFGAASGQVGVWNSITNFTTNSGIVDVSGAVTSVTVQIVAGDMGGYWGEEVGDVGEFVEDNFYSRFSAWTLSIAGLDDGLYDVYLYEPDHPIVGTGAGSLNGNAFLDIDGDYNGSFVQGGNYHLLSGVAVVGGALTATAVPTINEFSGLAGMQIVPAAVAAVPEAMSLAVWGGLSCLGIGAAVMRRRR